MRKDKALRVGTMAARSSQQNEIPTATQVSTAMSQQQHYNMHQSTIPAAAAASALSAGTTRVATETKSGNTAIGEDGVDMKRPNSIFHAAQQQQIPTIGMSLGSNETLEDNSSSSSSALLAATEEATHKLYAAQQTTLPNAAQATITAELPIAAKTITMKSTSVQACRLPSFDNGYDNKSKNKSNSGCGSISNTLLAQQQQQQHHHQHHHQQRTTTTTKSTPAATAAATAGDAKGSALYTSTFFTLFNKCYRWTDPKNHKCSAFIFSLNMFVFMLCLIALVLAFYSINRHTRNEQRLKAVWQLDERINALELRLQLCEEQHQQKKQQSDAGMKLTLNNERDSTERIQPDVSNLHNQQEKQPKSVQQQMPEDVTQTLHRLSRQVSDLHRLRRDVSHLQLSRRQQQRRQAGLATVTTADGLLLPTTQQAHSGECGCTAGEC
ncbi:uncharacterized protein LOC128854980 [Anastrepha ludens]|uniref:uncharacterized protein LOC128854980 n=1 Tax=Anastrepha ludens TaxID=28586 RepID=UPI0023B0212E|nr:uncharacterized protein LOC128854980 [Anastrepha ludens]XP_053945487.1 uncharacterized protein LOC128854980 [Anastrepha ludens]